MPRCVPATWTLWGWDGQVSVMYGILNLIVAVIVDAAMEQREKDPISLQVRTLHGSSRKGAKSGCHSGKS